MEDRLDIIEDSLLKFFQKYGKLPVPDILAANEQRSNKINFCHGNSLPAANNIIIGSVPVEELGLDYRQKFDIWGGKILYVVDKRFLCANNKYYTDADIIVKDRNLNLITDQSIYLLLSFGANGYGSYNLYGIKTLALSQDILEQENYDMDNVFIYSLANNYISNGYDDIIRFKKKSLFFIDVAQEIKLINNINIKRYLTDLSCECYNLTKSKYINNIVRGFCVQ